MKNTELNAALRPFIGMDVEFSVSLGRPTSSTYHTEGHLSVQSVRGMLKRLPTLAKDGVAITATLMDGSAPQLIFKNY